MVSQTKLAPEYGDEKTLEARYGVRAQTWRKWRSQGAGPPFYRIGRCVRYRLAEVESWLSAHREGGDE